MSPDDAARMESAIDDALARHDLERASSLAARYRAEAGPYVPNARQPGFRAAYLFARVALHVGRLEEARQVLGAMLPPAWGVDCETAKHLWVMAAEVYARGGQPTEARQHLEKSGLTLNDVWLQYRGALIRLWIGDLPLMWNELERWDRYLANSGEVHERASLLVNRSMAYEERGDLEDAGRFLRRALEVARPLGRHPVHAVAIIHLGRLAHLRGNLQQALGLYDEATAISSIEVQQTEIQLRRLLVLLDLGQRERVESELARIVLPHEVDQLPDEVRPLARTVIALVHGTGDADDEVAAHQALARGDASTAFALYSQAMRAATASVRQARLSLALGLAALRVGNPAEARSWLDRAVELARRDDLPEVLWRALQAKGELIAEHDGDPERARELFEQAVLASEAQARTFRHRTDAASHGLRRADLLGRLLTAAWKRHDPAAVLAYLELQRGRLLHEMLAACPGRKRPPSPRLAALDRELETRPSEELLLERDRVLDDYLRDRSRVGDAALPRLPTLADLQAALRPGQVFVAPAVADDAVILLAVRRDRASMQRVSGTAAELAEQVAALRRCLDGQLRRYALALPMGDHERRELDGCLATLGDGPLGESLSHVLGSDQLVWVPDGFLHGVPIAALRRNGRYLIEDRSVVTTFSAALFAHHRTTRGRRGGRAVVVSEAADVLPEAEREADGVAASFWRQTRLRGKEATRDAVRRLLPRAGVVHLACHAYFDPERPLSACVGLPSGETWRGVEWLDEPLAGLPLVTLSACRSAEVGPLVGREVFGLVTGLLSAGVRSVIAGLWPIADREAVPLMWEVYRNRLTSSMPEALAAAQRAALHTSPLFWAAFALFGDPDPLPPPWGLFRWIARWRQRRHAIRYPRPDEVRHAI